MIEGFERKIIHMPGTRLTPEVVLHRTLTKIERIKSVAVIIEWDDESFDIDWSLMDVGTICMASMVLHEEARRMIAHQIDAN